MVIKQLPPSVGAAGGLLSPPRLQETGLVGSAAGIGGSASPIGPVQSVIVNAPTVPGLPNRGDLLAQTVTHVTTLPAPWREVASIRPAVAAALHRHLGQGGGAAEDVISMLATIDPSEMTAAAIRPYLTHKDQRIVIIAAESLARQGHATEAVDVLRRFLSHNNVHEVLSSAMALAEMGYATEAAQALYPFLRGDADIALTIINVLSCIAPGPAMVTAIRPFLVSNDIKMLSALAKAMFAMGHRDEVERLVARLLLFLDDENEEFVVTLAAKTLVSLGYARECVGHLAQRLQTNTLDRDLRSAILYFFATEEDLPLSPEVVDVVVDQVRRCSADEDFFPLCDAVRLLSRIGHPIEIDRDVFFRKAMSEDEIDQSEAIRALGRLPAVEDTLDFLCSILEEEDAEEVVASEVVVCDAIEALIALDPSEKTADHIRPFLAHHKPLVVHSAIKSLAHIDRSDRMVPALRSLLTSHDESIVVHAIEMLAAIAPSSEAVSTLQPLLAHSDTYIVLAAAKGLQAIEEREQHAQPQDIARIRAACRPLRGRPLAQATGFDNRGRRQGRRANVIGDPTPELEVVPQYVADPRRIHWAATAARSDLNKGMVVQRRPEAIGSRPTLIVIDPGIAAGCSPRQIAVLAGTIAQQALQSGDPVGLRIGTHDIYVPPSRRGNQLERILGLITAAMQPAGASVGLNHLLEQPVVRQHLRPGTRLYVIADLVTDDPAQLESLQRTLRARGVEWKPIAVRRTLPVPRPIRQVGPARWPAFPGAVAQILADVANHHLPKITAVLYHIGAAVIDLATIPADDLPAAVVKALWNNSGPAPVPTLSTEILGTMTLRTECPEPADIAARCKKATNDATRWAAMLQEADANGWSTPFSYADGTLSAALQETSDATIVKQLTDALRTLREGMPAADASAYRPTIDSLADTLVDAEHIVRLARQRKSSHLENKAGERSDVIHLADSGVTEPKRSGRTWLRFGSPPHDRAQYLRQKMGVVVNRSTIVAHHVLSPSALAEPGAAAVAGTIVGHAPIDPSLLQPIGGSAIDTRGEDIAYTQATDFTHPLLDAPLATLRARGPELYGRDFYAALTDGPTLAEIAIVDPMLAASWGTLLEQLRYQPLRTALVELQQAISAQSGIRYRSYAGDAVAMGLWGTFARQVENGEATLLDSLRLTLTLGGGKCQEFALLGFILFRLAGIPTALSRGWVSDAGVVRSIPHAWIEIVLPRGGQQWSGIPIETAPPSTGDGRSSMDVSMEGQWADDTAPGVQTGEEVHSAMRSASLTTFLGLSESHTAMLMGIARRGDIGTAEEQGAIETALVALDIWLFGGDRPFFDTGDTWGNFLAHGLASFLRFNTRPAIAREGHADFMARLERVLSSSNGLAPLGQSQTATFSTWLQAMDVYFADRDS